MSALFVILLEIFMTVKVSLKYFRNPLIFRNISVSISPVCLVPVMFCDKIYDIFFCIKIYSENLAIV